MTPPQTSASSERVIRLSLAWIVLGLGAFLGLGFLGGLAAVWWFSPNPLPLPATNDRLVTTIEEVTISPTIASAENVARHSRSVVLLVRASQPEQVLGTGFVVTSDGLIATTIVVEGEQVAALDENGRVSTLAFVGRDRLLGISYLRAGNGVFVPFDVRDSDIQAGSTLLALSRNPDTLAARAQSFLVEEYRLPEAADPAGWQRILGGTELTEASVAGSPLLDDEGRVAGIILPDRSGRAVASTLLRLSLTRVAEGNLELHPYERLGFDTTFQFTPNKEGVRAFTVIVESVRPGSVAAQQGIRPGDVIATVGGEVPAWETSLYAALSKSEPLTLQIQRGETTRTVTLSPEASLSPSP